MRKTVSIVVILLVVGVAVVWFLTKKETTLNSGELTGTVAMSGAWALYPMAVKWAEEFRKQHPSVKIDIAAGGAGKGMADALAEIVSIGMVSRSIYKAEIEKGAWWVSVTKDAVVPTINALNPFVKELMNQGITREAFADIWINGKMKEWQDVITIGGEKVDLHIYTRSDACGAADTWAQYLGKKQEDLLGIGVYGDPGLAEAVKKDILGIGYNNINFVYDAKTKKPIPGVTVLPIDINANSIKDSEEDFYENLDELVKAIAEGRYPSPPARDLHFVCRGKPTNKAVVAFIRWVLTEGQQYVAETGYIKLNDEKIREGLVRISD